ncbi:MAG: cation/H(+) antiporter, partial [Methylibium sp.]|nr:cation/H(+) antiporter [Methylibium sp.]
MTTVEIYLIALALIFAVPYLIWRLAGLDRVAPLAVVQIVGGILLGPGVLGSWFPGYYEFVFNAPVVQALNGIAWWAVMLFVWIAGIELDLKKAWENRVDSGITAGLALGMPLLLGAGAALLMLLYSSGWMGVRATPWQFVLGVGMACAVTALPILILLMEKLQILREPLGQRILRYASLDDIAIWSVLALVLMDWGRVGRQLAFLLLFALATWALRRLMRWLRPADRWPVSLVWLILAALGADWAGLHFMVGAFLAGVVLDADWFEQAQLDLLRHHVLLTLMPVFFLSTGLRTTWEMGGFAVFLAAGLLLAVSVAGKLSGVHLAGRLLGWPRGEASV